MVSYTLREWDILPEGDADGCIPPHHAERLAAVARSSMFAGKGEQGVLEYRRNGLRARGVVGVLATDDCTLEILPKIDVVDDGDEAAENGAIRKRLVHMLSVALDIKIDTGQVTELAWQKNTLLEILIGIFCSKLTETLRRGMPRRYRVVEDDLTALRGRLDVTRQFTRHAANPSRLACRFDELSEDIALNQIMKAAVSYLLKLSRSLTNQQRLRELAFVYGDVSDVAASALRWNDVVIDRTNQAWQDLFSMAQLFMRERYQTTSSGKGHGTSMLFEMNTLFEEYVGRLAITALGPMGYQVTLQGGLMHCLTSLDDGRGVFQTKPDILIRRGGEIVHVIDTKWKRISSRIDDRKQGVSQSDVYQMMAYAQLYKAPRLTLLYPHHGDLLDGEGVQAQFRITEQNSIIDTVSLDVADGCSIVARLQNILTANSWPMRFHG